ncbi:hypothetical protein AMTRI_Chr11g158490 [Amborella trichopoda]
MSGQKDQTSPTLPWKTRIFISLMGSLMDLCRRENGTVNRRLLNLLEQKSTANGKPEIVNGDPETTVTARDVTLDPAKNLWVRVFTPDRKPDGLPGSGFPVIVFFHGGGFVFMSPKSRPYHDLCKRFSGEMPAIVVSVNYRLAPENRFPAPYDDGVEVVRWIAGAGKQFGDDGKLVLEKGGLFETADTSRCFLVGDSAGGNIVHHVGRRIAEEAAEFLPLKVVGHVLLQPFFGGEERLPSELKLKNMPLVSVDRADWHWKVFLPENSDRDHPACNVSSPNSPDISELDFPASLVVIGGFDPLQDWQRRIFEWLKKNGKVVELVEFPKAFHGFYGFPEIPEANQFFLDLKAFIEKCSQ